jgi:hypothetical protein
MGRKRRPAPQTKKKKCTIPFTSRIKVAGNLQEIGTKKKVSPPFAFFFEALYSIMHQKLQTGFIALVEKTDSRLKALKAMVNKKVSLPLNVSVFCYLMLFNDHCCCYMINIDFCVCCCNTMS